MDTVIEGRSAAKHTGYEPTSAAAEHTEGRLRTHIEGTSAAAEPTENRERTQWPENSIFRAPAHIRSGRESNLEPKLVSIGPYYHGRENLKRMEDFKLRCIKELLQNKAFLVGNPHRRNQSIYNVSVEPSTQGVRGIDQDMPLEQFMDSGERARAYYKQGFNYSDVEFVWMLVIDSCFIIRTILSLSQQVQESMAFLDVHIKDVRSDLLLLENQIPLFFIREVYELIFIGMCHKELPRFNTVLEPFICLDMSWRINHDGMSSESAHLLDFFWRCSLSPRMYMKLSERERDLSEPEIDFSEPERDFSDLGRGFSEPERDRSEQEQPSWAEIHLSINAPMVIANATELHKMAGIEFEKFKDKDHLDVTFFRRRGIMQMPRLKIDSRQATLLTNLIAFENCILPSMRTISCYMKLMDALIDSEKDVQLLQKCGVIYNTLRSHEMAATFFNEIGNICFTDNSTNPFSGLYKDVQKYYDSRWHRRLASLRQNYCSSPWAGISVIAGVTLLILSALQTYYTIYGYYKPNN